MNSWPSEKLFMIDGHSPSIELCVVASQCIVASTGATFVDNATFASSV